MNGKICIGSGLAAALIGQGVCHFTIGINFFGTAAHDLRPRLSGLWLYLSAWHQQALAASG